MFRRCPFVCACVQEYTRELETALERTSEPLSSAVDCLDKHHRRNDYDQLRLDEVEDTLTEVPTTHPSYSVASTSLRIKAKSGLMLRELRRVD